MENPDELMVQRAKNGDSAAFAQLYSFYAADLYRFACYYLGNGHDAEDAVQNAVLQAYRSLPALRKNSAFKSWLFKILSNCCKEMLEKRARRQDDIPLCEVEFMTAATGSDTDAAEVYSVLSALPDIDRNIILLSVIGGYKSAEIADMVGMRPGTVRSRQSRAMEKLREALS